MSNLCILYRCRKNRIKFVNNDEKDFLEKRQKNVKNAAEIVNIIYKSAFSFQNE
jgi:hypothetical protein